MAMESFYRPRDIEACNESKKREEKGREDSVLHTFLVT
jgi:hypothetical protein